MSKERELGIAKANDNDISFPVIMAEGYHLFPYRTQKLSLIAPKVLGGQPPGRIGRRRGFLCPHFFYIDSAGVVWVWWGDSWGGNM